MNCEVAQERIVAAAYGELADEQAHELERHLAGCAECRKEREQLLALKVLADAYPVQEPEANLVARARMRLERRWMRCRLGAGMTGWRQRFRDSIANLQAAPVAACLLLVVGVGRGNAGRLSHSRSVARRRVLWRRLIRRNRPPRPRLRPARRRR